MTGVVCPDGLPLDPEPWLTSSMAASAQRRWSRTRWSPRKAYCQDVSHYRVSETAATVGGMTTTPEPSEPTTDVPVELPAKEHTEVTVPAEEVAAPESDPVE